MWRTNAPFPLPGTEHSFDDDCAPLCSLFVSVRVFAF
jgi:hypothetical protein